MDSPSAIFDVPTPHPQQVTTSTDLRARNTTIVYSTVFPSIFVLTLLVVTRVIIRKRRRRNPVLGIVANSVYSIPNQPYVSPQPSSDKKIKKDTHVQKVSNSKEKAQYPRRALYKNQEHPVYIVPFTALPTDFDFSSRKVQVCSDFVIVKDLDVLQTYRMETPSVTHHLEEYKKQASFNPTFSRNHMMVY